MCGFAGKHIKKYLGKKIPRIVALDPAGVFFEDAPESEKLNPEDASVVEVIHTSGGRIGYKEPCGTIDFFPNGGSWQAGCIKEAIFNMTDLKTKGDIVVLK